MQVLRSLRKEIYNCWHGWEMRFDAFLNIRILSVKKRTPLKIGHKRQEKVSPIYMPYAQVKLVCPMEGNPAPIIEWSKGEQMVSTFSL